eukprot:6214174-Pleurochrysis_carterae.AAC.1
MVVAVVAVVVMLVVMVLVMMAKMVAGCGGRGRGRGGGGGGGTAEGEGERGRCRADAGKREREGVRREPEGGKSWGHTRTDEPYIRLHPHRHDARREGEGRQAGGIQQAAVEAMRCLD